MDRRPNLKARPTLERLEGKQVPSAGVTAAHAARLHDRAAAQIQAATGPPSGPTAAVVAEGARLKAARHARSAPRSVGFLAFRVTQKPFKLVPPFQQVLVQRRKPVPGQVYNVNSIAVANGTAQTFDASSGFTVRMTNQPRSFAFPVLTGDQTWKPKQVIVFYVLTKKYYPVSFVAGGFQLNLGGRSSTLVPGPSAIFLRLKYKPETFARSLNWIVAFGPGNQGGQGAKFGLPNTAINEIVSANTQRMDFGGHF